MAFQIDTEAVEAMVVKSLVDSITPEQREQVITDAISNLLVKEQTNRYGGRNMSIFESAMNRAISEVACKIFVEEVKQNEEVQARIKALVTPTIMAIAKDNYEGINEKIGEAIGGAVADWLRTQNWDRNY